MSTEQGGPDAAVHFARFKLDGDRFAGGRLPVDALVELERYRQILLVGAMRAWQRANPGAQVPEDFDRQFDLTIVDVENGSATSVLERSPSSYDTYYEAGLDETERVFSEIISGNALDLLPIDANGLDATETNGDEDDEAGYTPQNDVSSRDLAGGHQVDLETLTAYATLPSFVDLGSSLEPGERAEVPAGVDRTVRIDSAVRVARIRPVVERVQEMHKVAEPLAEAVKKDVASVAGRLISLNAEDQKFRIRTLLYGELNGKYADSDLTDDLKEVLNSSAQAPVVRVTGDMSWRDGRLFRIRGISSVELLEIEGEAWSRRIIELASLPKGWGEEEDNGEVISFVALDAARVLMRAADEIGFPFPGISPLEDGGVHVQWTRDMTVVRAEVSPDGEFELQSLAVQNLGSDTESRESKFETTSNLAEATAFIVGVDL